ncbi:hypothetical protein RchiOBHm_Chr1g0324681 [Rosa chinensis]|uniref:Uncharacterized protein n=1 Tax=Rosa chinensis TaxID=74649 RepID=A0A2P6S9V0_ROSCH|nr:hypothetical protein RchiOBHm_Chr1g0324681 [Rosa chinensis]
MGESLAVQLAVLDVVAGCPPLELSRLNFVVRQCAVALVLNDFVHPAGIDLNVEDLRQGFCDTWLVKTLHSCVRWTLMWLGGCQSCQ